MPQLSSVPPYLHLHLQHSHLALWRLPSCFRTKPTHPQWDLPELPGTSSHWLVLPLARRALPGIQCHRVCPGVWPQGPRGASRGEGRPLHTPCRWDTLVLIHEATHLRWCSGRPEGHDPLAQGSCPHEAHPLVRREQMLNPEIHSPPKKTGVGNP